MLKKKLLITVGAGASLDFGLPSVAAVDALLDACASGIYPLADDPTSNLYRHCREAIQAYYDRAPRPMLKRWANFEEVLYQLNLLVPYCSDPEHVHGSNALLVPEPLPDVLEFGRTRKPVDGNVLRNLIARLMDALVDHFIEACATVAIDKSAEIAALRSFLQALGEEFDVGIITLNYDNVLAQAWPGLYTGFDLATGIFDPLSVFSRSPWGFLYHLHGSIHFAMTGSLRDMHGITWAMTPAKGHAVYASGRNTQDSMEGTGYPTSVIVAGYGKTQQILRQPFRTYFAQVNRLIHEADSLLFLGYGFGDLHLNSAFSEVRDRRRPTVVVDWAKDDQDPLPFRHDAWAYQLFKSLPTDAYRMSPPGHSGTACIGEIKAANEVEVSNDPDYPLAVWYNGLLAACRHPATIMTHLR
jgi:hypothetical protein